MLLVHIFPDRPGHDQRTYECPRCEHEVTEIFQLERGTTELALIDERTRPACYSHKRARASAEPYLISIKLRTQGRGYIVVLSGALEVGPYAILFVRLFFLYDYGAHHGRGVAHRPLQHLNVWKQGSPSPSWNRSDGYGGDATAFTYRERSIGSKGCVSGRYYCKSGR
jgi:hypothetical protein